MIVCHDFATLCLTLIRFMQRIRDFSSRDVSFYAAKVDNALNVALSAIDTVGVWGSNPHEPTIFLSNLALAAAVFSCSKKLQSEHDCAVVSGRS